MGKPAAVLVQGANLLLKVWLPRIVVTGDSVIDVLLTTADKQVPFSVPPLESLNSGSCRRRRMTTPSRENKCDTMRGAGRAPAGIADAEPALVIVLPTHKTRRL